MIRVAKFSVLLLAYLCCHFSVADAATGLKRAAPEKLGMSRERLDRIGPVLQQYIDDRKVGGTVALIARQGKLVYLDARGYKEAASGTPMTADAIFRMASMTKPITSVAVMMLWEEGRLNLNDPVAQYLPEFKDVKVSTTADASGMTGSLVAPETTMTIRQLLTHTAGLANSYIGNGAYYNQHVRQSGGPDDTLEQWVKRIAELPLNYHPGEAWQYSNATDVLARIVEVVSGQGFDRFLADRIFEPLKMTDTSHYLPTAKLDRLTAQYEPDEEGRIRMGDPNTAESRVVDRGQTLFRGAGGLLSTAADYVRFQQMVLNGGELDGARLLSPKTVQLMTRNHVGDLPIWLAPEGAGFGLGYAVMLDRGKSGAPVSDGSFWWGGAYGTTFWVDPGEELIGILLIQIRPNTHLDIRGKFQTMVYQAIVDSYMD